MAALVQLFSFLFLLWPVVAEFPAGPGWEWVSSLAEMGGREFGEVAEPLVKMTSNARVYPEISPIQGWAVSAKVEPLWQAEGEGVLALVYEEEVEAERQRAVIAFRGYVEGNLIDWCASEVLSDDMQNTTLLAWCYATYKAATFDYYWQGVAYTVRVLESYPPRSVLLSGTSMGAMVAHLAAAGVLTHYSTALPVVSFLSAGRRGTMLALGLSLQGHYTSIISAANQWDPALRLNWEDRIGTVCLFPTDEPSICTSCFANTSYSLLPSHHHHHHHHLQVEYPSGKSQDCEDCSSLTHEPNLLLDLMLQGVNPTCYLMEDTSLPLAVLNKKSREL